VIACCGAVLVLAGMPAGYLPVSNERTFTAWSHVRSASVVRAAPSARGRRLGRITTKTYVGNRDIVVVLGRWRGWSRVRYARIGRQVGWVPTRTLWPASSVHTRVIVDLRARRLRAFVDGRVRLSVRVAVGAPASPTPRGRFFLRERVRVIDGATSPYGPLALGLSAFSRYRTDWLGGGQVAIHGTNEPKLIGRPVSNGCIRLRNTDVLRLGRVVGVGTPILVR
jgi:lipoprotein-anchoring transpeptidase ErfK/SrfK